MSKKLLALIITLVLVVGVVCSFSACNKTEVTPPTKGYTVIGKVVANGAPMVGVSVLVDGGGTLVTDENGMFIANGLDKDDVITFKKRRLRFLSSKHHSQRGHNHSCRGICGHAC